MLTKIWTGFWLVLLAASFVAYVVVVAHQKNFHPFRDAARRFKGQSWVGQILLGVFALGMWAYASIKPGDGISPEQSEHCEAMSLDIMGTILFQA